MDRGWELGVEVKVLKKKKKKLIKFTKKKKVKKKKWFEKIVDRGWGFTYGMVTVVVKLGEMKCVNYKKY